MFERVKSLFSASQREHHLQEHLDKLRDKLPVPVFWLFGKTQSGKTSIIKYMTGADNAEIGRGFQPCTRFSRLYQFPSAETPLLSFLDTRGLDEPGYDATEDLARFNHETHLVVATVKAMDHAQENVLTHLGTLRKAQPLRPTVLALTCLHEAYPQQQHSQPYPWIDGAGAGSPGAGAGSPGAGAGAGSPDPAPVSTTPPLPEDLLRSIEEQKRRFAGVVDRVVAIDLTAPEDGFTEPNYGGERLRQVILDVLPTALGQTIRTLDAATHQLQELYARQAAPHIVGYSSLAAASALVPIPFVDLFAITGIQTRMIYHLAQVYGQPMTGQRFLEIAGTLGLGMIVRQASLEMLKFIPFFGTIGGSVASSALAGASTFALGKAFCYYYRVVHEGHIPKAQDLRKYYKEQLALAEQAWGRMMQPRDKNSPDAAK